MRETMIDFKKFYNVVFYDNNMNSIDIKEATLEIAGTCDFMPKYDFSQVPDLPLHELVNKLINELPEGFTFVKTNPDLLNISLENICKKIRPDIKFIIPYGNIEKEWYDWAVPNLLLHESSRVHELYTVCKLADKGIPAGLVGPFFVLQDCGVISKNTSGFNAVAPNWQIADIYTTIPIRLLAEYRPEILYPNFCLLLSKAFLKFLDVDNNWRIYRSLTIDRFFPVNLAFALDPIANYDFRTVASQIDYPRYPGIIKREKYEMYIPTSAILT